MLPYAREIYKPEKQLYPYMIKGRMAFYGSFTLLSSNYINGNTVITQSTDTTQLIIANSQDCLNIDVWLYPP